jgi:hypothetical protein
MADAYNSCEKRYELAHIENLMTKDTPKALARGIYGHKVLEAFFNSIKNGDDVKIAESKAIAYAYMDLTYFGEVGPQIQYWINNVWPTLDWTIIEVEKTYHLPIGPDKEYPFTIDLLIETGGKLVIVDHKFSADAYSDEMNDMYPQIPIYMGALRAQGINVAYGIYNFLRTRRMKDTAAQLVRSVVKPNNARVRLSFMHQLETAKRIENHTGPYLRTFNNNCSYCPFISICRLEMSGEDSTDMKKIAYSQNTYGYEKGIVDL